MDERLSKSKSSAVILSTLAVLAIVITSAVLNMLVPYWITGDIHTVIAKPENLSDPAQVGALIGVMTIVFLLMAGIGAFWLHRFFGEAYFGVRGAWRWMLFGLFFALLSQVAIWLFPDNAVMDWVWPLASAIGAFFLARWAIPLKKKGLAAGKPSDESPG